MIRIISNSRMIAVLCLLLTLVISLWIGENAYFDEDLTVENMSLMSAPASAPASALNMNEGFQVNLQPVAVNETKVIETLPVKQPPFPEKYPITNVFQHIFGMSTPNERFEIPKI